MKTILLLFATGAGLAVGQYKTNPNLEPWTDLSYADGARIVKAVNGLSPYEKPALRLKTDRNYGNTPADVEPYGGVKPYKRHFLEQMEYTGAGRAIPEPPPGLKTVKIGFIGPIMSTVSVATGGKSHEEGLGIRMLQGAKLAIEEANARGGYLKRKIPFELVTTNDNGLWGASGNEIINMAYKDHVWAILGTIDGANSHIAIRVALKAEVVMMNTGDTDPTFIETNIPWTMRCLGDDRQMGYLLIDYMIRKMNHKRIGIIRSSNRYGRFGVREVRDSARRLKRPVIIEMAYKVGGEDFTLQLDRLEASNLDAVVHWGNAREGALILNQMRKRGMKQPFYASDRAVSDEFLALSGANSEGVMAGYPWNPDRQDPKYLAFKQRFTAKYGQSPETYAAHGYDGMNMLIRAIQVAGLNRAKIRDVLAYAEQPFPGVTGDIPFSSVLDDTGEVFLARYEKGAWRYYARDQLKIPYKDGRETAAGFVGPGGDEPEPAGVNDVAIGYFGPPDESHPDGGSLWRGATLALEEANRAGGYRGKPFRLVPRWSEDPWRSGAAHIAKMAFQDRVWAIIGGIEGAGTHLAEQVVAKALLPLVNPVATDRSIHMASVPWMFSMVAGDDAHTATLAPALADKTVVLVSATDHDSRAFVSRLKPALARHRAPLKMHIEFEPGRPDLSEPATRAAAQRPEAMAVIAAARDSARAVRALRAAGYSGLIAGGPWFGRDAFRKETVESPGDVIFTLAGEPTAAFRQAYSARYGAAPDYAAACAYDTVRILTGAIRTAGLNRSRIREALASMKPFEGASGTIEWDEFGQNRRAPAPASLGQWLQALRP